MFTDCPSCNRQFRIQAVHLSAAHGLVKCGYCGAQFNALQRLHDAPLPADRGAVTSGDVPEPDITDPDPQFDIPEQDADLDADAEPAAEPRQEADLSTAAATLRADENGLGQEPEQHEKIKDFQVHDNEAGYLARDDAALAELLLEEPGTTVRGASRWWWATGVVLVILMGTVQFLWFQRDEVLSRYPVLIPWVEQLCVRLDCNVIRFRDASTIKLLNRDVREHPRYEHALLVNATMSNQSKTRQPYPDIQLSLYDTEGSLIAHRVFTPDEYLDDSISITQGMTPDVPVHFVLEVTGPTEGAVSFEFKFL